METNVGFKIWATFKSLSQEVALLTVAEYNLVLAYFTLELSR